MGIQFKVDGLRKLISQIRKKENAARYKSGDVVVGYGPWVDPVTSRYAVYVHEDLGHKVWTRRGSGPKYLESPAKTMMPMFSVDIRKMMESGKSLRQAILSKGYELKKASQKIVPILTRALHDSAVVRKENW